MQLHGIDIGIIVAYIVVIMIAGFAHYPGQSRGIVYLCALCVLGGKKYYYSLWLNFPLLGLLS
jgi:hypothetical protein